MTEAASLTVLDCRPSWWVIERGGEGEGLGRTCTRYLVQPSCSILLGDDL